MSPLYPHHIPTTSPLLPFPTPSYNPTVSTLPPSTYHYIPLRACHTDALRPSCFFFGFGLPEEVTRWPRPPGSKPLEVAGGAARDRRPHLPRWRKPLPNAFASAFEAAAANLCQSMPEAAGISHCRGVGAIVADKQHSGSVRLARTKTSTNPTRLQASSRLGTGTNGTGTSHAVDRRRRTG